MSENNKYIAGNLLDYEYFSNNYKLITIDLSKHIELEDAETMQQINLVDLKINEGATMFFIIEKKEETTFSFSQNAVSII